MHSLRCCLDLLQQLPQRPQCLQRPTISRPILRCCKCIWHQSFHSYCFFHCCRRRLYFHLVFRPSHRRLRFQLYRWRQSLRKCCSGSSSQQWHDCCCIGWSWSVGIESVLSFFGERRKAPRVRLFKFLIKRWSRSGMIAIVSLVRNSFH